MPLVDTPYQAPNIMDPEIVALRKAIRLMARLHRIQPFRVLREVGVQADLKRLADRSLKRHHVDQLVQATIVDVQGKRETPGPIVFTDRVRLESKIRVSAADQGEGGNRHDRTDLLMYRTKGVKIFRHQNGPGDIVYRSDVGSIHAAVEIKASPSKTLEQKLAYAKDVDRLLTLRKREKCGVAAGFFVVLDKSSRLYGNEAGLQKWRINWEPVAGAATSLEEILYGQADRPLHKPRVPKKHAAERESAASNQSWKTIRVTSVRPDDRTKYVEIWDVAADPKTPNNFFAF